jgi:hypothetical protein
MKGERTTRPAVHRLASRILLCLLMLGGSTFAVSAPGVPSPISPTGTVTTQQPTYQWNEVSGATSYYLLVQNTQGAVVSEIVTPAAAGCSTGTCTYTPSAALTDGRTYNWFVNATNAGGTSPWSAAATITVEVRRELFPANCVMPSAPGWVNAPTGASTGWSVATDSKAEGSCSLKSNPTGDNGKARIRFGGWFDRGDMSFFWRVSSQAGFDCLRIFVDDIPMNLGSTCYGSGGMGVAGESGWNVVNLALTAGYHTVDWSYEKDGSIAAGGDAAWIDWLSMPLQTPITTPPGGPVPRSPDGTVTTSLPTYSWDSVPGAAAYRLQVQNTSGVAYSLIFTAAEAGCEFARVCNVTPALALDTARYNWFVHASNAYGPGPWSDARMVRYQDTAVDAFPAMCQFPTEGWSTAVAPYGWIVAHDFATEGACSLKSSPGQTAGARANLLFTGNFNAGNIMFDLKVSNQPQEDCLRFYIDGIAQRIGTSCYSGLGVSGELAFTPVSIPISAGTHTIAWAFDKDVFTPAEFDSAWIDNLVMPLAVAALAIPEPFQPNGGSVATSRPLFIWGQVATANQYEIEVAGIAPQTASFSPAACPPGGQCTGVLPIDLVAGAYTWRVRARNAGGPGAWSAPIAFTITAPPPTPTGLTPTGSISTLTPTFSWQASLTTTLYEVTVYGPSSVVFSRTYSPAQVGCGSNTGTCSIPPPFTFASGTSYYWFVAAMNAYGERLSETTFFNAPAGFGPAAPVQVAPVSSVATATPPYKWNASAGAASYYLLVQNTAGVAVSRTVTAAEAGCAAGIGACEITPANPLISGATYVWFLNAANAVATSAWSAGLTFTVNVAGPSVPQPPVLDAPSGTVATLTPNFRWNPSAGGTSYELIVQNTSGVGVNLSVTSSVATCQTGTCSIVPWVPLTNGATYNWFVRASNDLGTSAWSAPKTITVSAIGPGIPSSPVSIGPTGNTIAQAIFSWNEVTNATGYEIVVQNTAGVAFYQALTTSTCFGGICSAQPSGPIPSGTYSWFVKAVNAFGASAWSAGRAITVD